eukprot:g6561.t1
MMAAQGGSISDTVVSNLGCASMQDVLHLDVLALFFSSSAKSYGRKTDGVHEAILTLRMIGGEKATNITAGAFKQFLEFRFEGQASSLTHLAAVALSIKDRAVKLGAVGKGMYDADGNKKVYYDAKDKLQDGLKRRSSIDELVARGILRNVQLGRYDASATKLQMEMKRNSLNRSLAKAFSKPRRMSGETTNGIVEIRREELKPFLERRLGEPSPAMENEEFPVWEHPGKKEHPAHEVMKAAFDAGIDRRHSESV